MQFCQIIKWSRSWNNIFISVKFKLFKLIIRVDDRSVYNSGVHNSPFKNTAVCCIFVVHRKLILVDKWPLLDLHGINLVVVFLMQNSHLLKRFNHSLKSISLSFYILDVQRFIQGFEKKKTLYFQDYRKEKDIDFKTSTQKAVGIFALIVHLLKNAISNNKFNKTILKMH